MNFKSKLLGAFAALAVLASLSFSAVFADEKDTSATAKEDGVVTASLTGNPISFGTGEVTTFVNSQRLVWRGTGVSISDTQSYNDSEWFVSVSASDLIEAGNVYYIDSEYLSIWERSNPSCTNASDPLLPVVGNNGYQGYVTYLQEGPGGPGVPMGDSDHNVVSGTEGRGCGPSSVGLYFSLTVPAGTYTGNGTAAYEGNVTLTNGHDVGEGDNGS